MPFEPDRLVALLAARHGPEWLDLISKIGVLLLISAV